MQQATLWLCAATLLAACGSSGGPAPGPGAIDGGIAGKPFAVNDAVSGTTGPSTQAATIIFLTDYAAACSKLTANVSVQGSRVVTFLLGTADGGNGFAAASSPGVYPLYPGIGSIKAGRFALASVGTFDTACQPTFVNGTDAGSVTVSAVDSSGVSGNFDINFAEPSGAEHVTGSFHSTTCGEFGFEQDGGHPDASLSCQ